MKKLIESITGGHSASADVVDGTLILSLPDALSPVVWRMDLGHAKSSAIEVRERENGTFVLTLKTPREDVYDIAPFSTKAKAVGALVKVTQALTRARGKTRPLADNGAYAPARKRPLWLRILLWTGGLALVLVVLAVLIPETPMPDDGVAQTTLSGTPSAAAPVGAPVSADDFLMRR